MGYYRTVSRKQGLGITTLDLADMRRRDQERKEILKEAARVAKELEAMQNKTHAAQQQIALHHNHVLESERAKLLNGLHKRLPDVILQEAFNHIFKKSLVHDRDYIEENEGYINTVGSMYMKKLGGINGLASATKRTNSPFLKELLEFCNGLANEIAMEKLKATSNKKFVDETELREIINPTLDDEQRDIIDKKMDRMGADELANMVSNKVVDVVRDEQQREKDLEDTEKHMVDDMTGNDSEDTADSAEPAADAGTLDTAESTFTFENYNPVTRQFSRDPNRPQRTFFYSLMCGVANKVIRESAVAEGLTVEKKETPQLLLENPLNINIFDVYIQDKNEDLYDLSRMDMSDRPVIASTSHLDKDYILSEAVLQYTLFEVAHTMKLINITPTDIKQQSDFLMK